MQSLGLAIDRVHLDTPMRSAHQHFDLELNFVFQGWIDLVTVTRPARVPAGAACLFWAACPHRIAACAPGTEMAWVTVPVRRFLAWGLPPAWTRAILNGGVAVDRTPPRLTGDAGAVARWSDDARTGACRLEWWAAELESRVRRMTAVPVASAAATRKAADTVPESLQTMARFLADHWAGDVRCADAARAAGLHPNYASGQFRRVFGVGPREWLARLRLAHAQRLLLTTRKSVTEIAFESGFGSLARFYAWFGREHGCSPEAFRAK